MPATKTSAGGLPLDQSSERLSTINPTARAALCARYRLQAAVHLVDDLLDGRITAEDVTEPATLLRAIALEIVRDAEILAASASAPKTRRFLRRNTGNAAPEPAPLDRVRLMPGASWRHSTIFGLCAFLADEAPPQPDGTRKAPQRGQAQFATIVEHAGVEKGGVRAPRRRKAARRVNGA